MKILELHLLVKLVQVWFMCLCVCRLNREEGDGAWCPAALPSVSQYLEVCVWSVLSHVRVPAFV